METVKYKNPWYKAKERNPYSPEYFRYNSGSGDGIEEYKGFTIYARWDRFALCYDIVKDDICISQMAGPNGARRKIDELTAI